MFFVILFLKVYAVHKCNATEIFNYKFSILFFPTTHIIENSIA